MKAFSYDENYKFIGYYDCQCDQATNTYLLPRHATFIEPDLNNINQENEYYKFDIQKQEWLICDIEIYGNFYLKADGSYKNVIKIKDKDVYTNIYPNILDGDIIAFNDKNNNWEYITKGGIRIEQELNIARQLKIQELEDIYTQSQVAIINVDKNTFKVQLRKALGFDDFTDQVNSANLHGEAEIITYNQNNDIIVMTVKFKDLKKLHKQLKDIGVKNYLDKEFIMKSINDSNNIDDLNKIEIKFLPIVEIVLSL